MTGLVATPSVNAAESAIEIASDGWFPPVKLSHVREDLCLDGTITTARLRRAILHAIAQVNGDLRAWKSEQVAANGAQTMAGVPAEEIDGKSEKLLLYFRAVGAFVEADIVEKHRGYDLTAEGQRRAEQITDRANESRRNAFIAIRAIKGQTGTVSELV